MGFKIAAFCSCGFNTQFQLGGTRAGYAAASYFPHYCKTCGLISVNIAEKDKRCPKCASLDVQEYGKPPLSPFDAAPDYQWGSFAVGRTGNFCPGCKSNNLRMEIAAFID